MEKLSYAVDRCFDWVRDNRAASENNDGRTDESGGASEFCRITGSNVDPSKRMLVALENILLWEHPVNSIYAVIAFNLMFWSAIVLEIRGFVTASSIILVLVLYHSVRKAQTYKLGKAPGTLTLQAKAERIDKIVEKLKSTLQNFKRVRKEHPGVFCLAVCSVSLSLWLVGRTINDVLLAYTTCMSILIGPALLLQVPCKILSAKEWDSEIEEFLPAVTEDNLHVLTRAGDSGDHSPTPTKESPEEAHVDPLNDEELVGLKMPSYEDGSTDGLEISESELNPEVDHESKSDVKLEEDMEFNVSLKRSSFERSSSSEEEAELQPISEKLPSHNNDSDNDFEMIDATEIINAL